MTEELSVNYENELSQSPTRLQASAFIYVQHYLQQSAAEPIIYFFKIEYIIAE